MVSWFKRPGDSKLPQCKDHFLCWYLLTCNLSEQDRIRLKEGEEPVFDNAAAEGGNTEMLPAVDDAAAEGGNTEVLQAVGNGDEGGVAEALLQIGNAV